MILIGDPKTFCFSFDWPKDIDQDFNTTIEPHQFVINLSQRLDLRSSNKNFALQNFSIYYALKNIRKQNKNKALTWNDEFELPDGFYSVSDIRDYSEYIIRKYQTLATIPPFPLCINRINNRLMFFLKKTDISYNYKFLKQ